MTKEWCTWVDKKMPYKNASAWQTRLIDNEGTFLYDALTHEHKKALDLIEQMHFNWEPGVKRLIHLDVRLTPLLMAFTKRDLDKRIALFDIKGVSTARAQTSMWTFADNLDASKS